ncbi:hypothetical protein [Ramlibacter sp.]|uniref:hypothetical protein n=1 Tax=Ramlibacter sp. TaxID=1917967 RepID=UPI0026055EE0|nr:hypothetical protein [Ramlibacter sp.]
MFGPEEPIFRRAYFATNLVRANEWDLPGPPVLIDRQIISDLLDAASFPQIVNDVGDRTKDATIAGYVVIGLFMMWRFPDLHGSRAMGGVSLNKAFHFCAYIARELGWRYGDGASLPKGETKIKECWNRYKNVAHLWAAHSWSLAVPGGDKRSIYRDHLPELLSAARYFQMFGREPILDKKASKTKESILGADIWHVPDTFRALLRYDDDPSVYEDAPLAKALRAYVAK